MNENHCVDCCCARSWKALGISEYTGKSIPEHIRELRDEVSNDHIEFLQKWMRTSNPMFGNSEPIEMLRAGLGHKVAKFLDSGLGDS
jgi:Protein of unknown function (DUF2384)